MDNMERILKGGPFRNRYRFTGTLKTVSPLHIGTGEERDDLFSELEKKRRRDRGEGLPWVSTVIKDHNERPLIPGSAIKGVMRHWLLNVLGPAAPAWAATRDYARSPLLEKTQDEVLAEVRENFSYLELLFGTPFNAGKLEIWDAACLTQELTIKDELLHWNPKSLTYIDTSVAIDPATGTALDKLLYNTEIVPPGVEFELNLAAQNLSAPELGLLLLALQGFNSQIVPITIGARSGRGYGRFTFTPGPIYCLQSGEALTEWIDATVGAYGTTDSDDLAGYYALPKLPPAEQDDLIKSVQKAFVDAWKTMADQPATQDADTESTPPQEDAP